MNDILKENVSFILLSFVFAISNALAANVLQLKNDG
jgi:hypothetical protein